MDEKKQISTVGNSKEKISSDAENFYKNYWTDESEVNKVTIEKNLVILKHFFGDIPENKKIIEFGVGGEGGILYLLRDKNQVIGYDVSDSAINNCKKFSIQVNKKNLDIERTEELNESIDIIFAFEVFEHFSNPQFALEEIYRILKPGGKLLISTPNPYTYHWPRLFYPSLFTKENFTDFLLINGFHNLEKEQPQLFKNAYDKTDFTEKNEWSYYFFVEKTSSSEVEKTFDTACYFWNKTDKDNMRVFPIEASDLFRKCTEIDHSNIIYKCYLLRSLFYRYISNEQEEFKNLAIALNAILKESLENNNFDNSGNCLATFIMLQIEAGFFGYTIFDNNILKDFFTLLNQMPDSEKYIAEITKLESVYGKLSI